LTSAIRQIVESLASNKLLIVAASSASIVSIILPLLTYAHRRTKRGRRILFSIRSAATTLRDPKGKFRLGAISEIAIWNGGSEVVQAQDVAAADPIRIFVPNGVIHDARIVFETTRSNAFHVDVHRDGMAIDVDFDYISPNEGFKIAVLHAPPGRLEVRGIIKGFGSPKQKAQSPFHGSPHIAHDAPDQDAILPFAHVTEGAYESRAVTAAVARNVAATVPVIYSDRAVAPVWRRAAGSAIDFTIAAICAGLAMWIFFSLHLITTRPNSAIATFLVLIALTQLATKITAMFCGGETFGRRLMKLEIITFEGTHPNLEERMLRAAGELLATCTLVGLLWVFADEERLVWADHISRTFTASAE